MKDVPKIERPREKMEKYGPEKLKARKGARYLFLN